MPLASLSLKNRLLFLLSVAFKWLVGVSMLVTAFVWWPVVYCAERILGWALGIKVRVPYANILLLAVIDNVRLAWYNKLLSAWIAEKKN